MRKQVAKSPSCSGHALRPSLLHLIVISYMHTDTFEELAILPQDGWPDNMLSLDQLLCMTVFCLVIQLSIGRKERRRRRQRLCQQ